LFWVFVRFFVPFCPSLIPLCDESHPRIRSELTPSSLFTGLLSKSNRPDFRTYVPGGGISRLYLKPTSSLVGASDQDGAILSHSLFSLFPFDTLIASLPFGLIRTYHRVWMSFVLPTHEAPLFLFPFFPFPDRTTIIALSWAFLLPSSLSRVVPIQICDTFLVYLPPRSSFSFSSPFPVPFGFALFPSLR